MGGRKGNVRLLEKREEPVGRMTAPFLRPFSCETHHIRATIVHKPHTFEPYNGVTRKERGKKQRQEKMGFLLQPFPLPFPAALSTTKAPKRTLSPPTAASNTKPPDFKTWAHDFRSKSLKFVFAGTVALGISLSGFSAADAKVGVNKPELLPKEFSPVIDVAGFLSAGQENRLCQEIADLEKDTGFKLRILAQNYPDTPGLAVKDFWQVDDRTIVFVADPTFGNILNFNVGASVDLDVPRSFWSRLSGKYGNMFYWKEKGEDASIEAAVMAISNCLREPVGPNNCSDVK